MGRQKGLREGVRGREGGGGGEMGRREGGRNGNGLGAW